MTSLRSLLRKVYVEMAERWSLHGVVNSSECTCNQWEMLGEVTVSAGYIPPYKHPFFYRQESNSERLTPAPASISIWIRGIAFLEKHGSS